MTDRDSNAATIAPERQSATALAPAPTKPRMLPLFKVLLHNDDVNSMEYVTETIVMLTPLRQEDAISRMLEAHLSGTALLLVVHKERAELYLEQFASRGVILTMEPDA